MERDVLPACLPCGDGEYITAYNQALNQLGIHRISVLTAAFTCTQYAVGCVFVPLVAFVALVAGSGDWRICSSMGWAWLA